MGNTVDDDVRAWNSNIGVRLEKIHIALNNDPAGAAEEIVASVRDYGFAHLSGLCIGADPEQALIDLANVVGQPVNQSPRGELVEHVRDFSPEESGDNRGYRSGGELEPHTDPPSLLALHCLQPAKSGGESYLVNVRSAYLALADTAPDLLEELKRPFPRWQLAGQYGRAEDGPAAEGTPVFATADDVISCLYYRPFIEKAAVASGQRLTAGQVAALDAFDRVLQDREMALRFTLKPGQTVLLHNRFVLHARTDYEDWPDPASRRHLLRVWIDAAGRFAVPAVHELGSLFPTAGVTD